MVIRSHIGSEASVYLDRRVDIPEFWTIVEIDEDKSRVSLQRVGPKLVRPAGPWFLEGPLICSAESASFDGVGVLLTDSRITAIC